MTAAGLMGSEVKLKRRIKTFWILCLSKAFQKIFRKWRMEERKEKQVHSPLVSASEASHSSFHPCAAEGRTSCLFIYSKKWFGKPLIFFSFALFKFIHCCAEDFSCCRLESSLASRAQFLIKNRPKHKMVILSGAALQKSNFACLL